MKYRFMFRNFNKGSGMPEPYRIKDSVGNGHACSANLIYFMAVLFLIGCGGTQRGIEKYRETKTLMGTIVHLDVCSQERELEEIQRAYEKVWEKLEEIAWRMNVFDEKSDVTKINHSNRLPIRIPEDTYYVIKKSLFFSELTQGAFDITVWPLIKLWKDKAKENQFPSQEELAQIKQMTGMDKVEFLGNNRIRLHHKDAKVDLGGIAKGYAVDEAARIFREEGFSNFFIDAGGDIYVGGLNCKGEKWRIGIRDPRDKSKIIDVVHLSNKAVTTSGNYERYYEIQGERLSHIINPVTGYPEKKVVSATVIANEALTADALSTALSVLGAEKGTALIDKLGWPYGSLIILKQPKNQIKRFDSLHYKNYKKF